MCKKGCWKNDWLIFNWLILNWLIGFEPVDFKFDGLLIVAF